MNRDLREYSRQTVVRLIAGVLALLFSVGLGLIYLIYSPESALLGAICLVAGLLPVGLIALVLLGVEWVVKNARKE